MGFNLSDYEPVEVRLARFWERFPEGRVDTELVFHTTEQFIFKASIYRNATDLVPFATGFAEERVDTNPKRVNFASAAENGETSAIGRALANGGFAPKGARPSREEMTKASRVASIKKPVEVEVTDDLTLVKQMLNVLSPEASVRKQFVLDTLGVTELASLNDLTAEQTSSVLAKLNEAMSAPFTE